MALTSPQETAGHYSLRLLPVQTRSRAQDNRAQLLNFCKFDHEQFSFINSQFIVYSFYWEESKNRGLHI